MAARRSRMDSPLPPSLGCRVDDLRLLIADGEEPDRFLARWTCGDGADAQVMISKHADAAGSRSRAWRLWRSADPAHVLELLHCARIRGCDYEVVRHYPDGTLRDLLLRQVGPVPPTLVTLWVHQLTNALEYIHTELGLVHGALTPDVISVVAGPPRRLLVGGLGTARPIRDAERWRPTSSTQRWLQRVRPDAPAETALDGGCDFRYLSPERGHGGWGPEGDYWSLGVIVLELLVGLFPIPITADADDKGRAEFFNFIRTHHINASEYLDPSDVGHELLTLIDGLLTQSAEIRWGAEKVREWLDGGDPEVFRPRPTRRAGRHEPTVAHLPAVGPVSDTDGYVFISYCQENLEYVKSLASYLTKRGIQVWFDRAVKPGDRWYREIEARLRQSAAVIVVMTPAAQESEWVEREIHDADEQGIPIVPLLLEGSRFPRLSDLQYEDVVGGRMPTADFIERLRDHTRGGR